MKEMNQICQQRLNHFDGCGFLSRWKKNLDCLSTGRCFFFVIPVLVTFIFFSVSSLLLASDLDDKVNLGTKRSLAELEVHYQMSVLRGWKSFQTSFALDGLACVHCHPHHEQLSSWASAYPKVEVFDGTPYQVKVLRQVVTEAFEKHTDLASNERLTLIEDLVAYIAWWGDGESIVPGHSRPYLPPEEDLAQLRSSVKRGEEIFHQQVPGSCAECHITSEENQTVHKLSLSNVAVTFPHYVQSMGRVISLESFIASHLEAHGIEGYAPESRMVTDLAAYLMSLAQGKRLHPGGQANHIGGSHYD